MMKWLHRLWEYHRRGPVVRPWALAAPILVLLLAVPLIRLRKPAELDETERSRLATVQSLVERGTLAIDGVSPELATTDRIVVRTEKSPGKAVIGTYSRRPVVMSVLLSGWYWVMHQCGMNFTQHGHYIVYLLTVLGVTLPVAAGAGMIYRLGRIFELSRLWRAAMGFIAVCASGLVSYATVLSSNALGASIVLMACAAMFHTVATARPKLRGVWVFVAGMLAGLAATIDLAAPVLLVLFVGVILAMRWTRWQRVGAVAAYALGAAPPLLLHAMLTIPITGDVLPGFLHPELSIQSAEGASIAAAPDDGDEPPPPWHLKVRRVFDALMGSHGLVSHFPVVVFGIAGLAAVLRRHWPRTTKTLATVTIIGGVAIVGGYIITEPNWAQPMFSTRWFVLFLPLVVFWAGAWVRRSHKPFTWTVAGVLLVFSTATSLIGATNPFVENPTGQYTAYMAAKRLFTSSSQPSGGSHAWAHRR